jgi:hypothetical protein
LIEAGESDATHDEFLLPCAVGTISVYTYYKNSQIVVKKPEQEVGWSETKLYNLPHRADCPAVQSSAPIVSRVAKKRASKKH